MKGDKRQIADLSQWVPDGCLVTPASEGWEVREVRVMTRALPGMKRETVFTPVACEGNPEGKFIVQEGEKQSICSWCRSEMRCLLGSNGTTFSPRPEKPVRKDGQQVKQWLRKRGRGRWRS